jgi:hypothetical protein
MHIRTAWSDYFTGSPTSAISGLHETTQTLSGTNVYVSNCLFSSITSSSAGGALYCSSSVQYLVVESSSFFSCKTSNNYGGAIYFSNSGGQCVLYEICCYDCYTTQSSSSHGQFVYITVNNVISSKNYINYSSFSHSVNDISNSYNPLRLYYGKICCPSINLSMNKCGYYSIIEGGGFVDSNTVTCSFTYSSFADNRATYYYGILLWISGANYEIKSCNILRNTQGTSSSGGTIATIGSLMITDSCILGNNANYIFYQAHPYTITVSNCTLDSTSRYGTVTIKSTATKSFIHALNHVSNQICHSEYDSVGTLTPIIPPPSTPNKPILCYTYGKLFYQYQLSYLASLISIFLFNFVHLNSSVDLCY